MKRAFSVFAALIFLLAAGCGKQSAKEEAAPPPLPAAFTADLAVNLGGTAMTAKLTQNSSEEFEIQMLSPEIMTPLSLSYSGGACTVTYDGLTFESEPDRFPQAEFGSLLTQALACTAQDIDIQKTYSNGIWTYKGTGDRGIFSLSRSSESGNWLEFSVEGAELKVVFSNVIEQ